ncbi:MAG: DNA/RNA nuclease SfsA [Deltaproteobacteria bacterium]|nr:DNA/RNA nuclease SfsA [Deltaproteobacteria bacterium]
MKILPPLLEGKLIRRYKRFLTDVILADGTLVTAHTPNTGSMMECAIPGYRVILSRSDNPKRKLPYTLERIEVNGHWVDTHTHRANRVVEEGLRKGLIAEFRNYTLSPEFSYGQSRFDFLLTKGEEKILLEVKNVTLTLNSDVARFPDAVTTRGQKHLKELLAARSDGYRGVIFFLVQRREARSFQPADNIDPVYGELLRQAVQGGVEALAYKTRVTPTETVLDERIPVILGEARA